MNRELADPARRADRSAQARLAQAMAQMVHEAVLGRVAITDDDDDDDEPPALTVERAARPIAPARLAAAHLSDLQAREQAQALYQRCLAHYRATVQAHVDADEHDDQQDDAGAALACFVAANLDALHGTRADAATLLGIERQLAGVARTSAGWDRAELIERQFYFEQMAILAVLIGESSAQAALQGPAAVANVRNAARGYLRKLLAVDPDRLRFGRDGIELQSQPA